MGFFPTLRHSRKPCSRLANRAQLRVEQLETRVVPYTTTGNAWPHPQLVTISFEPDGTNLGGVSSNLVGTFNAKWATNVWQNQILRAAQVWAQQTGLNFTVITDNGGAIGSGSYQQGDPNMGDIRIGGFNFQSSTLASAYLPPPVNNYSIAGDIEFNTGQPFNIGTTYDLFTVAAHEFGHALGLLHSSVANAIMYGSYNTRKTALNSDDIAGIQAIYGSVPVDSVSNSSFATATDLTGQVSGSTLAALVTGQDLTTTSDVDYYTVTAPTGTSGTFTLTVQSSGISLLDPTVTVYAADQATVLGSATPSITYRTGTSLTVTVSNVAAGQQMYIKVNSYDATAFGTGAYEMTLNFGNGAISLVPVPLTQTLNGNPLSTGGGQPDSPPWRRRPRTRRLRTSDGRARARGRVFTTRAEATCPCQRPDLVGGRRGPYSRGCGRNGCSRRGDDACARSCYCIGRRGFAQRGGDRRLVRWVCNRRRGSGIDPSRRSRARRANFGGSDINALRDSAGRQSVYRCSLGFAGL
jgi:hypothetical protein